MSVAGIPGCESDSFLIIDECLFDPLIVLEERSVYYRETKNGLYTTLPFVISNTLVNIPFLFACTVFFTVICYWAIVSHNCIFLRKNGLLVICTGPPHRRDGILPLPCFPFPGDISSRESSPGNCLVAPDLRCRFGNRCLVSISIYTPGELRVSLRFIL
jgi:hypothetical protein